jgi:beta-fructofuranosidase
MKPHLPPTSRQQETWPTYHICAFPEHGVCMPYDANGCIYWKGRYHLMFIYQDRSLPEGGHCWGHLSSADLVTWRVHPPALVPAPEDPDVGIFSGNAFINRDGVPMLCWFGIKAGVCVATALDDDLDHWQKHPGNPIIPMPREGEPGFGVYTVWDPYLWLEGDVYHCLLGGNRLPNGKDTLYLCTSEDLIHWTPQGPFYEHQDPSWTSEGEDCSCPDFFALGSAHVLMCISHKVGCRCYVGEYDRTRDRFLPRQHTRMNWPGGMFFAADSLEDARRRRIFWAWVTDPRINPTQVATGSGVQSLPRVLSLDDDGTLRIAPAQELEALRHTPRRLRQMELPSNEDVFLEGVDGDCLEIAAEFDLQAARAVGLKVRCSPDGREETGIWYDAALGKLRVDMSWSTLRGDVTYSQPPFNSHRLQRASDNATNFTAVEAPLTLSPGEPLRLRVFLDGPMLEVYANDRQCVTQQIFPALADSVQVKACALGGEATLRSVCAREMSPLRWER